MTSGPATRADVRARIIGEAARLLHERGPVGVTTRSVAEASGVQAPTIYRLFGDKDGLLEAVAEQVMAAFVTTKSATVAAAVADNIDPLEDLRDGWRTYLDFSLANPFLFRLLTDPDRVVNSVAARSGHAVLLARVHRLAAAGRLRVPEHHAVDLIQAAGIGAIQVLLAQPKAGRDLALAEAMFDAVLDRMLLDEPSSRATHDRAGAGVTAAAVAFRAVVPKLDALSGAERELMGEWLDRALNAGHGAH